MPKPVDQIDLVVSSLGARTSPSSSNPQGSNLNYELSLTVDEPVDDPQTEIFSMMVGSGQVLTLNRQLKSDSLDVRVELSVSPFGGLAVSDRSQPKPTDGVNPELPSSDAWVWTSERGTVRLQADAAIVGVGERLALRVEEASEGENRWNLAIPGPNGTTVATGTISGRQLQGAPSSLSSSRAELFEDSDA